MDWKPNKLESEPNTNGSDERYGPVAYGILKIFLKQILAFHYYQLKIDWFSLFINSHIHNSSLTDRRPHTYICNCISLRVNGFVIDIFRFENTWRQLTNINEIAAFCQWIEIVCWLCRLPADWWFYTWKMKNRIFSTTADYDSDHTTIACCIRDSSIATEKCSFNRKKWTWNWIHRTETDSEDATKETSFVFTVKDYRMFQIECCGCRNRKKNHSHGHFGWICVLLILCWCWKHFPFFSSSRTFHVTKIRIQCDVNWWQLFKIFNELNFECSRWSVKCRSA